MAAHRHCVAGPWRGAGGAAGGDDYAKERRQFGRAIANFQAIGNMLADGATQLEAARLLTLRAAFYKENGVAFPAAGGDGEAYASEMAGRCAIWRCRSTAATATPRSSRWSATRATRGWWQRIYEGTSEIQRLVIARSVPSQGLCRTGLNEPGPPRRARGSEND